MNPELVESAVSSIEFFLNPTIFSNAQLTRQISDHLIAGDLIVIRNAFQDAFAQRMFDCLDQFSDWKVYEGYEKHFHYHHHNIYDEILFPPDLRRGRDIFGSEPTKTFVQQLSKRECTGAAIFSASLYLPGDHSLPHNDFIIRDGQQRQLAFVWNLTKHWQADWGGEFFWCKKNHFVQPTFNTLLLFNVERSTKHFVTIVAPHAKGKRLAISGWWTGQAESENSEAVARDEGTNDEQLVEII